MPQLEERNIRALENIAHSIKQMAKSMDNIMRTFVEVGSMIAKNLEADSDNRNPNQEELDFGEKGTSGS